MSLSEPKESFPHTPFKEIRASRRVHFAFAYAWQR
jgi:hypothetical protein|tara:strand:- start:496 stop:600 length:105 start_codon:yes stop_codon:yes gene_type:complete